MARRRIPAERHYKAAKLLLAGWSAYDALLKAGYSHWTARNPSKLLNNSAPLRTAIEEAKSQLDWQPPQMPKRRRRQHRRITEALICPVELPPSIENRKRLAKIHRQHTSADQRQRESNRRKKRQFDQQTSLMPPEVKQQMGQCDRCNAVVPKLSLQHAFGTVQYWCRTCIEMNPGADRIGTPRDEDDVGGFGLGSEEPYY